MCAHVYMCVYTWACMCMYICVYVCVSKRMCACVGVYVYAHMCGHMCVCMCGLCGHVWWVCAYVSACICVGRYVCLSVCKYMCVGVYVSVGMCMCVYVCGCVCLCVHVSVCVHLYIHVCVHTYTHTQLPRKEPQRITTVCQRTKGKSALRPRCELRPRVHQQGGCAGAARSLLVHVIGGTESSLEDRCDERADALSYIRELLVFLSHLGGKKWPFFTPAELNCDLHFTIYIVDFMYFWQFNHIFNSYEKKLFGKLEGRICCFPSPLRCRKAPEKAGVEDERRERHTLCFQHDSG